MNTESNIIDRMKPLQILYNLEKAGINTESLQNSTFNKPSEESVERWAERIWEDNKNYFEEITNKEEFINFVLYGK